MDERVVRLIIGARTAARSAEQSPRRRMQLMVASAGGARCFACGDWHPARDITVDLIVPVRDGGVDEPSNLSAVCDGCRLGARVGAA
jgi:hypothetical protein